MKHLLLIFVSVLVLMSCDTTTEPINIDYDYDYYPLFVGKYIIYDVDSVVYDPSNSVVNIDTISYQAKEEIVDTTTDGEGRTSFIIHYSIRQNSSEAWQIKDVYTTVLSKYWAERVEQNFRFVKLLFPSKIDSEWDGNRYFNDENVFVEVRGETLELFKSWYSFVVDKGTTETIGNNTFQDVLTIHHADDENLIEKRLVKEKYVKNIGLVEKTMMILDTQCGGNLSNCNNLTWEQKAEKGFILRMVINNYN